MKIPKKKKPCSIIMFVLEQKQTKFGSYAPTFPTLVEISVHYLVIDFELRRVEPLSPK